MKFGWMQKVLSRVKLTFGSKAIVRWLATKDMVPTPIKYHVPDIPLPDGVLISDNDDSSIFLE